MNITLTSEGLVRYSIGWPKAGSNEERARNDRVLRWMWMKCVEPDYPDPAQLGHLFTVEQLISLLRLAEAPQQLVGIAAKEARDVLVRGILLYGCRDVVTPIDADL